MDRLCEITSRMNQKQPAYEIPAPDYDLQDENDGLLGRYSVRMEAVENMGYDAQEARVSPDQIRRLMSKEQRELQKDLKIMQKRGMDFQTKRPEFKVKHHEIKSKGMQKKESEQSEQSELNMKLKSRSDIIKKAEDAKKVEDDKPEFMKIHLRKGATNSKV